MTAYGARDDHAGRDARQAVQMSFGPDEGKIHLLQPIHGRILALHQ